MSVRFWACTSAGSCATSFVLHALPFLQFIAVVITIVAGLKALLTPSKKS